MSRANSSGIRTRGPSPLWLLPCLPAILLPISNPDLFWHLSAARRIWGTGAIPREEWLSWTMDGSRWVDFEWLSQLAFGAAYAAGGLAGAWALKAALIVVCAWRLLAWLKLYEVKGGLAGAALAVWSAAMLPRADLRPELFSALLFIELFRRLEAWRLSSGPPSLVVTGLAFALWANLHAGFAYGLALLGFYSLFGLPWRVFATALAATLVNPEGPAVYGVLLEHASDAGRLGRWILEWRSPDVANPWRWAELALVPAAAWAAFEAGRRGRPPHPAPALVLAALAAAGLRHARMNVYFAAAAIPLGLGWLAASGRRVRNAAAVSAAVACGLWSAYLAKDFGVLARVFEPRLVPLGAAAFLEREAGVLGERALYNPWGWGGYLGWRLGGPRDNSRAARPQGERPSARPRDNSRAARGPEGPGEPFRARAQGEQPSPGRYRVFQDGRYVFHPLLLEAGEAAASPDPWRAFLERRGVEVALMENVPLMLPSVRRYPDGTERMIPRPYYAFYMPRERWALVYFDEQALVFVRRDALESSWIAAREFRWLRPRDDEAFQDALLRGEIPKAELATERARLP